MCLEQLKISSKKVVTKSAVDLIAILQLVNVKDAFLMHSFFLLVSRHQSIYNITDRTPETLLCIQVTEEIHNHDLNLVFCFYSVFGGRDSCNTTTHPTYKTDNYRYLNKITQTR